MAANTNKVVSNRASAPMMNTQTINTVMSKGPNRWEEIPFWISAKESIRSSILSDYYLRKV